MVTSLKGMQSIRKKNKNLLKRCSKFIILIYDIHHLFNINEVLALLLNNLK